LAIDYGFPQWDNYKMGTRGFDRSVFWQIASRGVIALVKTVATIIGEREFALAA